MTTNTSAAFWRNAENPTAGNWYTRGGDVLSEQRTDLGHFHLTAIVATVPPGLHALADARLLAAAPDLRTSLRATLVIVRELLTNWQDQNASSELVRRVAIAAESALDKSEGR